MKFSRIILLFSLLLTTSLSAQKVALVTGSAGGIGIATVTSFQEQGWKVWAGYHTTIPTELQTLENVTLIQIDVTNDQQVQDSIQQILATDGHIDALINNAGYGMIGAEETMAIEDVQNLFEVNFFGCLRMIKAVAPAMRSQNSGHIINISSTSGVRAVPGLGHYAASKFALEGLCESLAVTLSPWNIKVSIVEPGTVKNDWVNNCIMNFIAPEDPLYSLYTRNLYTRLAMLAISGQDCSEIGDLIVNVAENPSPDMRYQTSQKVVDVVSKKLVDPSGNAMRDQQKAFFDSLTSSPEQ